MSRVALYVRVSTADQKSKNQLPDLEAWAARAGHEVVKVYTDHGFSGTKGRDKRPAFDAMLKDCVRRKFDVLAVWSSDRLGRSMKHAVEVIETVKASGVNLYIDQQGVDTTTPIGRSFFYMSSIFAEMERDMIVARVNAGIARARKEGTKSGKPLGRPAHRRARIDALRAALLGGRSVREAATAAKVSRGTAGSTRKALVAEGLLAA
jgi:DNA invertase Pin-like site-specific DNA recombinase